MCLISNSNHPSAVGVCLHMKPREQILDTHAHVGFTLTPPLTNCPFTIRSQMSAPLKMKLSFPEFPLKKNTLSPVSGEDIMLFCVLILISTVFMDKRSFICSCLWLKELIYSDRGWTATGFSREGVKYSTADCTASLCMCILQLVWVLSIFSSVQLQEMYLPQTSSHSSLSCSGKWSGPSFPLSMLAL